MTNTIELSKRLLELADYLSGFHDYDGRILQWIADLKSIAIPEPVGYRELAKISIEAREKV